jgi:hypothetical protein
MYVLMFGNDSRSPRFSSHARSHSNSALGTTGHVRSPSGGLISSSMLLPGQHVRSASASGLHTRTPSGAVNEASGAVMSGMALPATAVASPRSGYASFGGATLSGVGQGSTAALMEAGASPRPSPRLSLSPRPSPRPHLHVGGVSNAGFELSGSGSPLTPERFTPRRMLSAGNGLLAPNNVSSPSATASPMSNVVNNSNNNVAVLTSSPSIAIVIEAQPSNDNNGSSSAGTTPYLFQSSGVAAPASPRRTPQLNPYRLSMHGSSSAPHPNFTPPSARKPSILRAGSISPYQSHDGNTLSASGLVVDRSTLPGAIVEVANAKANEKRLSLGAEARANLEERFAKLGDKRGSLDLKRTSLHGQSLNERLAAHAAAGGVAIVEKRSSLGRSSLGLGALQERLQEAGYTNKRASLRLGPSSLSSSSLFPMFTPTAITTLNSSTSLEPPPPTHLSISTASSQTLSHHLSSSGPSQSQMGAPPLLSTASSSTLLTTNNSSTNIVNATVITNAAAPLTTNVITTTSAGHVSSLSMSISSNNISAPNSVVGSPALTSSVAPLVVPSAPASPSTPSVQLRALAAAASAAGPSVGSPLLVPTSSGGGLTTSAPNSSPPNSSTLVTPSRNGSVSVVSLGPTMLGGSNGAPLGISPPISPPHSRRDTWRLGAERSSHATTSFLSPTLSIVAANLSSSSANAQVSASSVPSSSALAAAVAAGSRHQMGPSTTSFSQAIAARRAASPSPPPPPASVVLANFEFNRPPDS